MDEKDEAVRYEFRIIGVLEMCKTTGPDRVQVCSRTLMLKYPAVKVASLADETDSEKRHKAVACVLGRCDNLQYAMAVACLTWPPTPSQQC